MTLCLNTATIIKCGHIVHFLSPEPACRAGISVADTGLCNMLINLALKSLEFVGIILLNVSFY